MNTEENNLFNSKDANFGLPGGYFEKSAGSIINKIEWEEEHNQYPRLYSLVKQGHFIVPDLYFTESESRLELLHCPVLFNIAKTQNFNIPAGYFENAEVQEISKVLTPESDELSSFKTLGSLEKQPPFKVDEHYFEVNEKLLTTLLKPEKSARVINLFFSRSSYVAAAFFVIAIGLWLYSIYVRPVQELKDCGTMACVDRADLVKIKNLENLDDEELYELVNPKDLEKKLEKKTVTGNSGNAEDSSFNNIGVDEIMDEI